MGIVNRIIWGEEGRGKEIGRHRDIMIGRDKGMGEEGIWSKGEGGQGHRERNSEGPSHMSLMGHPQKWDSWLILTIVEYLSALKAMHAFWAFLST